MILLILKCLIIILIYSTIWFWVAVYKNRNDIADIVWGLGYILICIFLYFTQKNGLIAYLVYSLICLWGLRLSVYIFIRNKNKKEDFRYLKWRKEWGDNFLLRSYLQVFLFQGLLLLVIICPVFLVAKTAIQSFSIFTFLGILIWIVGFIFQAVGDYQLSQFLKLKNKGILETGLWRFSRHPNYFGEIMMWWGIFTIIVPLENSIFFIISPLTISILIIYVSGIPLLENKQKDNLLYQKYKKKTSVLFPLPPKE